MPILGLALVVHHTLQSIPCLLALVRVLVQDVLELELFVDHHVLFPLPLLPMLILEAFKLDHQDLRQPKHFYYFVTIPQFLAARTIVVLHQSFAFPAAEQQVANVPTFVKGDGQPP